MTNEKLFTPKISLNSNERIIMYLSDEDAQKVRFRGSWSAEVTDVTTQISYKVKGCQCSITKCMCDAYIVQSNI
ncbi:MAG: hypothetical protein KGI88_08095 [Betaproteobacteria bacterium]|nr:hypothetical protein [Betaproteobacteria bacterium]